MLNILFINHNNTGNSAIHIHNFANALIERGYQCILSVPDNTTLLKGYIAGARLYRLLTYAETLKSRNIFSNGKEPDILHAWTPRELVRQQVTRLKQRFPASKLIVHLEDNEEVLLEKGTGCSLQKLLLFSDTPLSSLMHSSISHPRLYKQFLEETDGVTIIIDSLCEFLPDHKPHLTLWPIIDVSAFATPSDLQLRRQLGIREDEFVITYTGNAHAANAREMRSLYLAVALANQEGIPTRLIRTGEDYYPFLGEQTAWAHQYSCELGIVKGKQIPPLLALADTLIQPGKADRFNNYRLPSKIPEYLATGKPVALPATNIGHVLKGEEEALLLKQGDGLEILDVIKRIKNDPKLAAQLGNGGKNFATIHFNKHRIIPMLEEFYHVIMQTHSPLITVNDHKTALFDRYRTYPVPAVSYATVRDYCDSRDNFPELSQYGDLKNVQRPWAVKAILSQVKPGSHLLEIGAGEPVVADFLHQCGYHVTIVDPYDGSGNGPTEYEAYKERYPHLKIIRKYFDEDLSGLDASTFDCIYSISVLEHVPDAELPKVMGAIFRYLCPGGVTLHAIDYVLAGQGEQAHEAKLRLIAQELNVQTEFQDALVRIPQDVETYFLSAEAHYGWKGTMNYDQFPFRKVVSMHICTHPDGKTEESH